MQVKCRRRGRRAVRRDDLINALLIAKNSAREMLCRLRIAAKTVCERLLVLHKLVSLCHAVIEFATAVHINFGFDRLLQALQELVYGLQKGDIGVGLVRCHLVGYGSSCGDCGACFGDIASVVRTAT